MLFLFLSALQGYEDKGRAYFAYFLNKDILAIKISLLVFGAKNITKKKKVAETESNHLLGHGRPRSSWSLDTS